MTNKIVEKCLRCKKKINLEVNIKERFYCCPQCNVMVANIHYVKN